MSQKGKGTGNMLQGLKDGIGNLVYGNLILCPYWRVPSCIFKKIQCLESCSLASNHSVHLNLGPYLSILGQLSFLFSNPFLKIPTYWGIQLSLVFEAIYLPQGYSQKTSTMQSQVGTLYLHQVVFSLLLSLEDHRQEIPITQEI